MQTIIENVAKAIYETWGGSYETAPQFRKEQAKSEAALVLDEVKSRGFWVVIRYIQLGYEVVEGTFLTRGEAEELLDVLARDSAVVNVEARHITYGQSAHD